MYVAIRCRMVTLAKFMKLDTFVNPFAGTKLLKDASYLQQPWTAQS
jgi:hypothetical protein